MSSFWLGSGKKLNVKCLKGLKTLYALYVTKSGPHSRTIMPRGRSPVLLRRLFSRDGDVVSEPARGPRRRKQVSRCSGGNRSVRQPANGQTHREGEREREREREKEIPT